MSCIDLDFARIDESDRVLHAVWIDSVCYVQLPRTATLT